jgi:hypothetical protein
MLRAYHSQVEIVSRDCIETYDGARRLHDRIPHHQGPKRGIRTRGAAGAIHASRGAITAGRRWRHFRFRLAGAAGRRCSALLHAPQATARLGPLAVRDWCALGSGRPKGAVTCRTGTRRRGAAKYGCHAGFDGCSGDPSLSGTLQKPPTKSGNLNLSHRSVRTPIVQQSA